MYVDPAEHFGLVCHVSKQLARYTVAREELVGQGIFGLLRAAEQFDPAKGCKFASFAGVCIYNEMVHFLRKDHRYRRLFSLSSDLGVEVEELASLDVDEHKLQPEYDGVAYEQVAHAVARLPPREAEVIRRYFGTDGNCPEKLRSIARSFGISPQRVQQIARRALRRLRSYMSASPIERSAVPSRRAGRSRMPSPPPPTKPPQPKKERKMPLTRKNEAPPRELPSAQTHNAVCIGHYHIGTQETPYGDKEQVILSFAIDERRSDGQPFILSTNALTLSFDDRATLAKYIRTWTGKPVGVGEEFDTASLVDRPCLLTISHGVSAKGNAFAAIDSITSLPKGMPPFVCDLSSFDYSPIDPSVPIPGEVPGWVGEKIQQSREWAAGHAAGSNGNGRQAAASRSGVPDGNDEPAGLMTTHPSRPPMAIVGYVGGLGIEWPYSDRDLDTALMAARAGGTDEALIAEYEKTLRLHSIPF